MGMINNPHCQWCGNPLSCSGDDAFTSLGFCGPDCMAAYDVQGGPSHDELPFPCPDERDLMNWNEAADHEHG